MALSLINLDEKTRKFMIEEIELDIENDALYLSERLSTIGHNEYPTLLKQAAQS